MTKEELQKVYRRMLWVIPGMLLAMIGDYCMGIEPKDSYAISGMISSGWLSIADWRIALSNIGGLLGTVCYTIAALPFAGFLKTLFPRCRSKWDRRLLKLYIAGLILGVMSFLYFHLACGTLIHNFNVLYELHSSGRPLLGHVLCLRACRPDRMDRSDPERNLCAEERLDSGRSADHRRDRLCAGAAYSLAVQRLRLGL